MKIHRYTNEEDAWLVKNINSYKSYAELLKEFKKQFYNVSIGSLVGHCYETLKLRRNYNGRYGSGKEKSELPVLTERDCGNGTTYIKVQESKGTYASGYAEPCWIAKQKYIYEQYYNIKLSKDKYVIFLDGNRYNFEISNLYCIDRKISIRLAQNNWYTDSREHTLTAIKLCELLCAIKEKNE